MFYLDTFMIVWVFFKRLEAVTSFSNCGSQNEVTTSWGRTLFESFALRPPISLKHHWVGVIVLKGRAAWVGAHSAERPLAAQRMLRS